jgi:Leucine-rich repeat (LRR) protein
MKICAWIFVILFPLSLLGQASDELLDSLTLATYQEYTNLDSALKNPNYVIKLTLRKKKYKKFPVEIFKLTHLQYLDISKNAIKELPDSIVSLKNLQYLIASKTGLKILPRNIGELKNLKHLNVNQNDISMLPQSFGKLENLEVADLWSNNLDYFPESLVGLTSLKLMDLRNILIPQEHQDRIQSMIPKARIEFSPPCRCSW